MVFEIKNYATLKEAVDGLCEFLSSRDVPEERVFDSKLVACELLGNVLRHEKGEARLHGEIKDGCIVLKILSENTFTPPETPACAEVFSENGRGLFLVKSMCEEFLAADDGGIRVKIRIRQTEEL